MRICDRCRSEALVAACRVTGGRVSQLSLSGISGERSFDRCADLCAACQEELKHIVTAWMDGAPHVKARLGQVLRGSPKGKEKR